jgi:glycosyltransferase involved in cell wall biosynthesis
MSQLPHAGRGTHAFIERMTTRLPGVELRLGSDIGAIPGAIRELVENSERIPATAGAEIPGAEGAGMPLVSVIIPVYNGGAFLPEAIRNVQSQQYPAVEIIVVDDGSTEDIGAVVRALPTDVRFFTQDNAGAGAARNRGIRDSSGELVAFLDVDDLWPVGNLSALVHRLVEHPEADLVRGRAQVTRYTGAGEPGEYLGSPSESFPHYIGSGVYRRRAFETVGLFDPELRFGEDTDWYARARERGLRMLEVEEVTLFVRRHDGNMTRGKTLVELNQLRLFKKALDRKRLVSPSLD